MKIRAITPILVDETELSRRQARYDRLAPAGWSITLENLPTGPRTPDRLSTQQQIRDSEAAIAALDSSNTPSGFDALMPDCVLDPAVPELTGAVLGITRLSAHVLAAFGIRFGVLTRNEAIGAEYRTVIERYGLAGMFDGVYVLGLSVADIADEDVWNAAVERVAQRALSDGTTVLINGCSAVEVTVADGAVRVIDPTGLALKVAELGRGLELIGPGGADD